MAPPVSRPQVEHAPSQRIFTARLTYSVTVWSLLFASFSNRFFVDSSSLIVNVGLSLTAIPPRLAQNVAPESVSIDGLGYTYTRVRSDLHSFMRISECKMLSHWHCQ